MTKEQANQIKMSKWYVEYKAYGKFGSMGKIEAKDGNEAIEYVKANVIGVNRIVGVWHDDDDAEE